MMILHEQDTKMREFIFFLSQKFPLIKKILFPKRSTAIEMAIEMSILRVPASIYIVFKYL